MIRGMVVYGQDSLDEISMSAPTSVCEIKDGWFQSYELTPEQFGYKRCDKKELTGGSPEENAEITRAILSRRREQGARRQAVCLNAGAALYITGKDGYDRSRRPHGRKTDRQWCGSKETGRIHCRKFKVASMNILEEIAERTRVRIAEEEAAKPLAQLRKEAEALWEKELAQGVNLPLKPLQEEAVESSAKSSADWPRSCRGDTGFIELCRKKACLISVR